MDDLCGFKNQGTICNSNEVVDSFMKAIKQACCFLCVSIIFLLSKNTVNCNRSRELVQIAKCVNEREREGEREGERCHVSD